jgi:hypothetical protein
MVMENDNTMRHIVSKFKHEVKNFLAGQELSDDLYHALYDYYSDHGEMPYGIAKGRDGDPYEWVHMRFDQDVHDYTGGDNQDVPALPQATMPGMPQESMFESKKVKEVFDMNLLKGLQGSMSKNAKDPESERNVGKKYGYRNDQVDDDEDNYDEYGNEKPGKKKRVAPASEPTEKRSKGRPSAAVQSSETGEQISDYKLWYHKSKRKHPERKIVGSSANAIAVVPKGKKYLVVSKWENGAGVLLDKPDEVLSLNDLQAFKSAKGRPKKVREWIETLRFVAEGAKVDRMVKHIEKSEKAAGKSDKDAESIAYATANKRGMLDNKNKKVSEGEVTKTSTGLKHTAKDKYGASEAEPEDEKLDKAGTNRREKAMGVKWDRENKWGGGIKVESTGTSKFVVWYMVDDNKWDKKSTFNSKADADAYIKKLADKGYDDDNFEVLKPGAHPNDGYVTRK